MKYFTILFLLVSMAAGQDYRDFNAKHLYDKSEASGTFDVDDSTSYNSALGFYVVNTTTSADSATSMAVLNNGFNDKTVVIQIDSLAGTTSTEYFFGKYQGPEYGWTWVSMGTLTADAGKIIWHVGNQSWASYEVLMAWAIKFVETGAQRNRHGIRIVELQQ